MQRTRPQNLIALSNHELGERLCEKSDAIDAGMSLTHPATVWAVRDLLMEAAARLHKGWPGEKPTESS